MTAETPTRRRYTKVRYIKAGGHHATIRQYLIDERIRQGLPQVEVADRMGVLQSSLSLLEHGHTRLDLTNLTRWSAALGLQPVITFAPLP